MGKVEQRVMEDLLSAQFPYVVTGTQTTHLISRRMPYPLGHSNYVYWKNLKSNMRKIYITSLDDILNL